MINIEGFVTRTSSIKITDGCLSIATMKSVRTSFSASPTCVANEKGVALDYENIRRLQMMTGKSHTHFDVNEEAETLKNAASDSDATALASIVFPLPGGPKRSNP